MESLSELLTPCEGNPPVTGGFPSQRASDVEPLCFLWCESEHIIQKHFKGRVAGTLRRYDAHGRPL